MFDDNYGHMMVQYYTRAFRHFDLYLCIQDQVLPQEYLNCLVVPDTD